MSAEGDQPEVAAPESARRDIQGWWRSTRLRPLGCDGARHRNADPDSIHSAPAEDTPLLFAPVPSPPMRCTGCLRQSAGRLLTIVDPFGQEGVRDLFSFLTLCYTVRGVNTPSMLLGGSDASSAKVRPRRRYSDTTMGTTPVPASREANQRCLS